MKPIQLWLPTLMGGAARDERQRDIQRLHGDWDSHSTMWTLPGWSGPSAWSEGRNKVGCVSGEELECYHIIHIGSNSAPFGMLQMIFPDVPFEEFLDMWLSSAAEYTISDGEREFEIRAPVQILDSVSYCPLRVTSGMGGTLPIGKVDDSKRMVFSQWPPGANDPKPISIQVEAQKYSRHDKHRSLKLRLQWRDPLERMMPRFPNEDDLLALGQMKFISEEALEDRDKALHLAEVQSRNWLIEGRSNLNLSWLKPIIAAEGEFGATLAINTRFDVDYSDLSSAYSDPTIQTELRKPVTVRRVLGVPGLAWALLIDRLNDGRTERLCKRCGSPIAGRSNKQYCGNDENPKCFKDRRKSDRQRSRQGMSGA